MNPNKIYTTTDYGQFVFRAANRDVDDKHVDKIAKLMKENGWKGAPIQVSEGNNVDIYGLAIGYTRLFNER